MLDTWLDTGLKYLQVFIFLFCVFSNFEDTSPLAIFHKIEHEHDIWLKMIVWDKNRRSVVEEPTSYNWTWLLLLLCWYWERQVKPITGIVLTSLPSCLLPWSPWGPPAPPCPTCPATRPSERSPWEDTFWNTIIVYLNMMYYLQYYNITCTNNYVLYTTLNYTIWDIWRSGIPLSEPSIFSNFVSLHLKCHCSSLPHCSSLCWRYI